MLSSSACTRRWAQSLLPSAGRPSHPREGRTQSERFSETCAQGVADQQPEGGRKRMKGSILLSLLIASRTIKFVKIFFLFRNEHRSEHRKLSECATVRKTDLETDAVLLFSQVDRLLHHTLVLALRKRACGINYHTARKRRLDARPTGETCLVSIKYKC